MRPMVDETARALVVEARKAVERHDTQDLIAEISHSIMTNSDYDLGSFFYQLGREIQTRRIQKIKEQDHGDN